MEIHEQSVKLTTVKLRPDESIFELIKLIKPSRKQDTCTFLKGPLWMVGKTMYKEKLANRIYSLIKRHVYRVEHADKGLIVCTYLKVSSKGNVHEITREEACEIIDARTDYVEDFFVMAEGDEEFVPSGDW